MDLTPLIADPARGRSDCLRPRWALVLGGADCVWDDVLAWEREYGQQWDGLLIAANDIGAHWPRPLDHWASLHPNKFRVWEPLREKYGFPNGYLKWTVRTKNPVVDYWVQPWGGGSSGMLAAQVAIEIGCTHVVLCGVPMTPTGHFAETKERFPKAWTASRGHWKAWVQNKERLAPVRSMSGETRELLGAPSLDWLGASLSGM